MCIDYRFLNDCSAGGSWPIPNIKGIFERLRQYKSSRYGAGYHQEKKFPLPKIFRDMKKFVGVAGYFHDRIKDASGILRHLHALMPGYTKKTSKQLLQYNAEAKIAFHHMHIMVIQRDVYL